MTKWEHLFLKIVGDGRSYSGTKESSRNEYLIWA